MKEIGIVLIDCGKDVTANTSNDAKKYGKDKIVIGIPEIDALITKTTVMRYPINWGDEKNKKVKTTTRKNNRPKKLGKYTVKKYNWKLQDPIGTVYELSNLVAFCKVHGISVKFIRDKVVKRDNTPVTKNETAGWSVIFP